VAWPLAAVTVTCFMTKLLEDQSIDPGVVVHVGVTECVLVIVGVIVSVGETVHVSVIVGDTVCV